MAVRFADQTVIYDNTEPQLRTIVRLTRTEALISALGEWRSLDEELS